MRILVLNEHPEPFGLLLKQLHELGFTNTTSLEFRQSATSLLLDDADIIFVDAPCALNYDRLLQLRHSTIVPILMLARPDDEQALICAYQAGIDDHLEKPVSSALLNAKLQVWQRWLQQLSFVN